MSKTWKRLLSVVLAAILAFSPALSTAAENAPKNKVDVNFTEIDPSAVKAPKWAAADGRIKYEQLHTADVDLNEVVRVSIFLNGNSTLDQGFKIDSVASDPAAISYRDSLKTQQQKMIAAIENVLGSKLDVKWTLSLAVNLISANVRLGDIVKIESLAGVDHVSLENQYLPETVESADQPNSATSTQMINADYAWASGYTGAGSRIAIIDSGIEYRHQSFNPEAFDYALEQAAIAKGEDPEEYKASLNLLTQEEVARVAGQLNAQWGNLDAGQAYLTEKIPYAYNYIDADFDTAHPGSVSEHGSHVAGIAAANRFIKTGEGEFVSSLLDPVVAVGTAPDAQLLTMKVFGKGGGAYDSDYMAAIEDAIILGCDSANLSLGSANPGYSYANDYQHVMDKLVQNGMVVTMSGGNNSAWFTYLETYLASLAGTGYLYLDDVSTATGGSPGSFFNSFTIGSADNIGSTGSLLLFNDSDKISFTENTEYGNAPISSIPGKYEYVLINSIGVDDNEHVGQEGDEFLALGSDILAGKVALCYRGSSSFFAKCNAAAAQGAIAVVIINNQEGTIGMNLTGYEYTVPAVSITQADGNLIIAGSERMEVEGFDKEVYTGTIEISGSVEANINKDRSEAVMSSFSSWGTPGSLALKPEMVAPGGSIYSVNGKTTDGYVIFGGTSMAAPHATGMAAILAQYIRESGLEAKTGHSARQIINSLLMSTATPMIDPESGMYFPILQQGSGLADVDAAINAKSLILMDSEATSAAADGKVKAELGDDPDRDGVYEYSFTINNFSDMDLEYGLWTDIFTQDAFMYYANAEQTQIALYMDSAATLLASDMWGNISYSWEGAKIMTHDVNGDGVINEYDVSAILESVADFEADGIFNKSAADMDGDGDITSRDAYLLLQWIKRAPEDEVGETLIVPAGKSVKVNVTIAIDPADMAYLDTYYTNGAYIEGFTFVYCMTDTGDGARADVEYSIPILGFYGNWTDASMFDHHSAQNLMFGGDDYPPYSGQSFTSALVVDYAQMGPDYYLVNPFWLDEEDVSERAALNSESILTSYEYTLIRNAVAVAVAITDADGKVLWCADPTTQAGMYYHVNNEVWMNNERTQKAIGVAVKDLGLEEGDEFTVGIYAIPEYTAMNATDWYTGGLYQDEFIELIESGTLGEGASLKQSFILDDTAPEATGIQLLYEDGAEEPYAVNIEMLDNNYIALAGLMDSDGYYYLFDENENGMGNVPEQTGPNESCSIQFPYMPETMSEGFTVVLCDYAGNYSYYAVNYTVTDATIVEINADELTLMKGDSIQLEAYVYPILLDDKSVTWASTDESVVTVDETGLVKAVDVGEAYVLAYSNKTPDLYAYCYVAVVQIEKSLQSIIWDEVGDVWPSTFEVKTLPEYTKLTKESLKTSLTSLTYDMDGTLFGVAFDNSAFTSTMYTVDPSTWDLEWHSESEYGYTDIAPMTIMGTPYFAATYGPYVMVVDGQTGQYTGVFDLSKYTGGNSLVGIAYEQQYFHSTYGTTDWYYVVDTAGNLINLGLLLYNGKAANFTPTVVGNIGVTSDTDFWNSLYFDGVSLYWSRFVHSDNLSYLTIIYDLYEQGLILNAGNFGDGVWPAGGLMDLNQNPTDIVYEPNANNHADAVVEGVATMDVTPMAPKAAEAAKGSLNSFRGSLGPINKPEKMSAGLHNNAKKSEEPEEEPIPGTPIEIKQNSATNNGVITVKITGAYVNGIEISETLMNGLEEERACLAVSDKVSDNEEILTIAYASLKAIPKDEAVITIYTDVTCEDVVITTTIVEANRRLNLNSASQQKFEGSGHDWVFAGFNLIELGSFMFDAEVYYICMNDMDHITSIPATLEMNTVYPTCVGSGLIEAHISIDADKSLDGQAHEDSVQRVYEPLGHSWKFDGFEWIPTEEGYDAIGHYICTIDETHTEAVEAEVTVEVIEATLSEYGATIYTALISAEQSLDGQEHTVSFRIPIEPTGFAIKILDYTNGAATTDLTEEGYLGSVNFTVNSESAVVVALATADGYEELACTFIDGVPVFNVYVDDYVTLVIALRGDANLDGEVGTKDATLVRKIVAGTEGLEDQLENLAMTQLTADANADGTVGTKDATLIRKIVAGVEGAEFPWKEAAAIDQE